MENILKNKYIMKDFSHKNLHALGFSYNKIISDCDRKYYSMRFPVVKYNSSASIEGEITIDIIIFHFIIMNMVISKKF